MQLESQQFSEPETETLDTPNFDDEKTLLSAQPVVPLAEVPEPWKRRNLGFSAGIGFLAIGLCVAALIQFSGSESKSQPGSIKATESADRTATQAVEGVNSSQAVDSSSNSSNVEGKSSLDSVATAGRNDETPSATKPARRPKAYRAYLLEHDFEENDGDWNNVDEHTRREMRREAKRAERRARRAAEREDEDNGVFRVPDLFEGTRRP